MTDYKALRETLERARDVAYTANRCRVEAIGKLACTHMPQILAALRLAEVVPEVEKAARSALDEMCRTVAPRNSFTDAADALDAALAALQSAKAPS